MLDDVNLPRRGPTQRILQDVLAPGLDVVFVGINPGRYSGAAGHHFAGPNNRFWKALHGSGFTDRLLDSSEDVDLSRHGLGVTNFVPRTTASAAELTKDELRAGAVALTEKLERFRPRCVAFLGIETYAKAFARPKPAIGKQEERLGGAEVWVLPNPSGANAHYPLEVLVARFAEMRASLG